MTYTIKPLVWLDLDDESHASTVIGNLHVGNGHWWTHGFSMADCDSNDHGKQLAWEWYVAKLGEALEPVDG